MKLSKTAIFTGLVVLATASGALAFGGKAGHGGGEITPPAFSDFDQNGDGSITADEINNMKSAQFAKTDTDGNGELSAEELITARQKANEDRVAKMIERFDKDGSGGLSLDEMPERGKNAEKRAERMIKHMDENDDGAISQAEFDKAMENWGHGKGRGKDDKNDG